MSTLNTQNGSPEKRERCRKLRRKAWKKYRLHTLAFAVVFAVCCLYALFQMTNSKYVTVTINSASVAKGQNPDGTAFDIYQILSDEVLEAASQKLGGKISAAELKRHLTVSDALTAKTNQQLKQSILDGEYKNIYFPAAYHLTYETVSDVIAAEGVGAQIKAFFKGLVSPNIDRILEAVAESYQKIYEDDYLNYSQMFVIDWTGIDAMDYYNRAEALRTEAMRIQRFLQDRASENTATNSLTNLTYGDLNNDLLQLIDVDVQNHQAYIIQNNITTSRDTLLRQFSYMEEIYIEEMERKSEEYLILNDAVDMYDSTTTKVVFIPALDQNNSFYMNRTKVGLDYLVERADAARLAADEAEHDAQYYGYLQTCFADAVTPSKSRIEHADAVYLNIKERIINLAESTQMLLEESNQTDNEGIKVTNAGMSAGIVGVGFSFAKRFVILSMAAYVLICIFSGVSTKKRTDTQEV